MPKATSKRKIANGYKLAEPLPLGEVLQDISKKKWKLGPSIGQGGFGQIYSAREASDNSSKYPYVIKIEPHSNGPLFVESHFYMKNSKPEDVMSFKKKMSLKTLGMPMYLGSGSHEYCGEKYRFIVMEKFGTDLWKIFLENNRIFPTTTVFKVAIQMLDVLQYIHSRGYVHADLKGTNILMGNNKDTQNKQLYLVDFGLAAKYNDASEFKPNPKKAHDGTIEYLSRDAHQGVQTMRGDMEVLAYNIIHWLGCTLPWENHLKDPNVVQKLKQEHMSNMKKFMKTCFANKSPPDPLLEYLNYLSTLNHNSKPDYEKIRKIFSKGLDSSDTLAKPFNFTMHDKISSKKRSAKRKINDISNSSPKRRSLRLKALSVSSEDEEEHSETDDSSDSEESSEEISFVTKRRKIPVGGKENDNKISNGTKKKILDKTSSRKTNEVHLDGYTDAMKEVLRKKLQKDQLKKRNHHPNKLAKLAVDDMTGFNEGMKEVALKRRKNVPKMTSRSKI